MSTAYGLDAVIVLCFFAVCLAVGVLFARQQKGFDTFVLAGHSLGFWHVFGTIVSTIAGFSIVFAHAIYGYKYGISVMWSPPAVLIAFLLFATFVSKLKRVSEERKYKTYADMLLDRYDRKTQVLGSLLTVANFLALASINVYGIGLFLSTLFEIPFSLAVPLGAGIVVIYVILGGFLAVVWTDLLQLVVTLIGLCCLIPAAYAAVAKAGGLAANLPTEFFGPTTWGVDKIIGTYIVVIPILFSSQDIWQRVFSARDMKTARNAVVAGGFLISIGAAMAVYLGMCSRALLPDIDAEYALPALITHLLPSGMIGLLMVAYLAAFTSSADSFLLVVSSAITQDFFRSRQGTELDEKTAIKFLRIVTLICGVLVIAIITAFPNIVGILFTVLTWLMILVPATLSGFFWKHTTANAAFWSILIGWITAIAYTAATADAETAGVIAIVPTVIVLVVATQFSKKTRGQT
ncbi:MAG: sodium:solute symporter family protein [Planctomycetes bacterium]|nr:sodium:solute symporter family protein [Planctomycetota bacterium]